MRRFDVRTSEREQMVDVTERVAQEVRADGVAEGWALVYVPHTTAGVTVNENADPSVTRDLLDGLRRLVPREGGWHHVEGNADGHVKASLVGSSVTVPVSGGGLALGTWQGVYLCEFDGPRRRQVFVQTLGK
ncbi:MAG: YjbQ family protein [Coriobacteriia bacterium]|nr:YjbQ family protein [Coriobacteriia bacterium]